MKISRVFLIHGWDGTSDNHWFPFLKMELAARGWEVNAPQMPHADAPKIAEWLEFLKAYVGRPNRDTYFVGHSLGCLAIVRYIVTLAPKARIGGCVFVAGFSGHPDIPEISEFYTLPFEPEKAKAHCRKFVMIFSDNDPYVPMDPVRGREGSQRPSVSNGMEQSLKFAKQLGAKTVLERGKGHFTASDGVTALPSVLQALLRMSVN